MKYIYINGRFLTQNTTGVQRVAEEVVKELDKLVEEENITQYKFCVLTPKNSIKSLNLKNISVKTIGKLQGHAWEQLELPLFTKKHLLINFCNTAPMYKKNQIVYIHDTAILDAPEGFSNTFIKVYSKIFNAVSKRSKHIITVSEFSQRQLIHHFPVLKNKISYSHLGIEHVKALSAIENQEILKKFNLEKSPYFLAVSSANPNKNFKIISDMLEKSSSFEEDFILVGGNASKVFGEGAELSQKIHQLGYVTDDELIALYSNAKAFIFPSKYEGFGLPPIEAMSQGCPVIASDCASIPEVLKDKAIYFNNKDYNSLYTSLNKIRENNIDRQDLLSFVGNKYSWKKTTKHLYDIILKM